jgi:hypothetical protein
MRNPRLLLIVASAAIVALAIVVPGTTETHRQVAGSATLVKVPQTAQKTREIIRTTRAPDGTTRVERTIVADRGPSTGATATRAAKVDGAAKPDARIDRGIRVEDRDTFDGPGEAPPPQESGPCAKASTCSTYVLRQARWKTDKTGAATIAWKFNDSGRRKLRAPEGLLESALASSMSQWSAWNSNIRFQNAGTTTASYGGIGKDGSCDDGTNVVTWARFDPEVIAQAGTCMDDTGRIVRDADLALNVTYHWEDIRGEPESRHSFDIRSIVTHELGHWLGLLDLYSSSDVHQTMSGYSEYSEISKRTPALGDILGIQKLFPCGEGDTCPRSKIAND